MSEDAFLVFGLTSSRPDKDMGLNTAPAYMEYAGISDQQVKPANACEWHEAAGQIRIPILWNLSI